MALDPTGYLDFSWDSTPGIDGYKVKLYKNNSYYKTDTVTHHNIRVSGLIENDLIHGFAYPYKSDITYPSFSNLSPQYVPVSRFDETLALSGIKINSQSVNLSEINNYLSGEFIYSDSLNKINLSIASPRSENILYDFNEDPFLDSIHYNIYSSGESFSLLDSKEVNSFYFDIVNTGQYGRNYIAEISVNDFYGSGVTGNVSFFNDPISIKSISINHSNIENNANINVLSSYTKECTKIDYVVYDNNDFTGDYLLSGNPTNLNNYDISLDLDFSGAIKIIPHDLYGTGYEYINRDIHFADLSSPELFNKINNSYIEEGPSYSTYNIRAESSNISESGSYFELSIDPNPNSNFDLDSYFTGRFDDFSSGYMFDFFPFIDPIEDNEQSVYFNLNLHQSGTSILEDSATLSKSLTPPKFYSSGISFDYVEGLTNLSFEMNPKLGYTGINLMVSGKNDSDYVQYSDINYEVNDLYPHLKLRIVNSLDSNTIYDEIEITGSGMLPSISVSEAGFVSADGMKSITIENNLGDVAVNQVRSYGRFAFVETSSDVDTLGEEYNDILAFSDYLNFEEDIKYLGNNLSVGPPGLTRNANYTIPNSTASYESGLHYIHRFVPENGYGTGAATEVLQIEYPINSFGKYMDGNQQATDQSISNIQNNFASQSYVNIRTTSTSSHSNTGATINLDTSSNKHFIINNNNQSSLSINFQNISDTFFNTSVFLVNSTNLNSVTFQVNGANVSSRGTGSYTSSYHSLDIKIASFSNTWYITNTIT